MDGKNTAGNLCAAAFVGWPIYLLLRIGCEYKKEREIVLLLVAYVLALLICYMFTWVNRIHDLERWSETDEEKYEKLLEENRKLKERQQFMDEFDRTMGPGSTETALRIIREQTQRARTAPESK